MLRCAIALLLLAFLAPLSFSKSKIIPPADSDYVLALGAANDFLRAWQRQDCEAGILLLTDRVKQRTPEDALVSFFSRTVRRAQSFEIMHGKKLAPGRYRFPVSLFQRFESDKSPGQFTRDDLHDTRIPRSLRLHAYRPSPFLVARGRVAPL